MRSRISLIFMVANFFSFEIEGQNLVPNNQFEYYAICPAGVSGVLALDSGWTEYGSADCFNACDTTNEFDTPVNVFGYQVPLSGSGYVGIQVFYQSHLSREYIEVPLLDTLDAGQTYYVRFYVSLGDTMQYAIENLGTYFTVGLYDPYPGMVWTPGIPQVENTSGNMLNDTMNWMTITGSFVAMGGETHMTIGNFKDDSQTVKQYFGGTNINTLGAYYLIEDVYVGLTPPPVGVNENDSPMQEINLYPNPTNSSITLEFETNSEKASFSIMSYSGQIVMENENLKTIKGKNEFRIDLSDLSNGIYFIQVRTETFSTTKKIIKN